MTLTEENSAWQRSPARESGNPERPWIPGQARNDKREKIYIVGYRI
jgi:hypothetical protein